MTDVRLPLHFSFTILRVCQVNSKLAVRCYCSQLTRCSLQLLCRTKHLTTRKQQLRSVCMRPPSGMCFCVHACIHGRVCVCVCECVCVCVCVCVCTWVCLGPGVPTGVRLHVRRGGGKGRSCVFFPARWVQLHLSTDARELAIYNSGRCLPNMLLG